MTQTVAEPYQRATHADGQAIFDGVVRALMVHGWTRHRTDSLAHDSAVIDGKQWVVAHHFSAGCWTLTFQPDPYWHRGAHQPRREAKIDRNRPLPSIKAVLSQLFGRHVHLAGAALRSVEDAT